MKAFVLVALVGSSLFPQDWKTIIVSYLEDVRSGQQPPVPDVTAFTTKCRETLNFLHSAVGDTDERVAVAACNIAFELSKTSSQQEIRRLGVAVLLKACMQGRAGSALDQLTGFASSDFSPQSRADVKALLVGSRSYRADLIRLASFLQLTDMIPLLKRWSAPGNDVQIRWSAIVGLARMGDAESTREMLSIVHKLGTTDETVYNVFPDLVFSRHPDAIAFLIDALKRDDILCLPADPERDTPIPCAYRIMELLASVIEDFPVRVGPGGDLDTADYPHALQSVRRWFSETRHYRIIRDQY